MKLSILICSLQERKDQLDGLFSHLLLQMPQKPTMFCSAPVIQPVCKGFFCEDVEVVSQIDNGEQKISAKRNDLLLRAQGDYICFVDDDDQVPDYYIAAILAAIEYPKPVGDSITFPLVATTKQIEELKSSKEWIDPRPDVVGFTGRYFVDGKEQKPFIHSIKYNNWFEDGRAYYRCPTPLNPIKRELCLKVGFNERLSLVEDHDFSIRIRPLLKTEVFIDKPMYFYYFVPKKSRADTKQEVKV